MLISGITFRQEDFILQIPLSIVFTRFRNVFSKYIPDVSWDGKSVAATFAILLLVLALVMKEKKFYNSMRLFQQKKKKREKSMEKKKLTVRGELALLVAILINSMGVLLMLQSGSGISAISSVPYAFSEVFPQLTLGTWTYIFQGLLVITLMTMKKRFVPSYLFSFVAGFAFGELMDIHELWITKLPLTIPLRILYFVLSYLILCFGIALSNRCKLPIIPTDLFPRDLAEILQKPYSRVKITFDVTCLLVTGCLTYFALGKIMGLGIGTVIAAFTMGKGVAIVGNLIDKKFIFVSVLSRKEEA